MGKTDRDSRRKRRETKKEGLSSVAKQTSQPKCAKRTKSAKTSATGITRTSQQKVKEKAIVSSTECDFPLSQTGRLIPKFCSNVKALMKANKGATCTMIVPEQIPFTNDTPVDNLAKDTEKESEEIISNKRSHTHQIADTVSGASIQESKMSVRVKEAAPDFASSMPLEKGDCNSFDLLKPSAESAVDQEYTQSSSSMVHPLNCIYERQIEQPNDRMSTVSVGQKDNLSPHSNKRVHDNESFVCSGPDSATTVLTDEGTRPLKAVCHQGNDSSVMAASHTELKFLPSEEAVGQSSHSACNSCLEPEDHKIDQDRAETADDHKKQHETVIEVSERNGVTIYEDKNTCFSDPSACTPLMPVDTAQEQIYIPKENINEDLTDAFNDYDRDVEKTVFKILSCVEYKQSLVKDSYREDEVLVPCHAETNAPNMIQSLTHTDKYSNVKGEQQGVKIEKHISNEGNQGIQLDRGVDMKLQTTEPVMDCNPMQSSRITEVDSGELKMKAPISNCDRNENSILKESKNGESLPADDDTDNFVTTDPDRNPISCISKRDVSQNMAIDSQVEKAEHVQDSLRLHGTSSILPSGQQLQHTGLSHQNGQDMFESSCTDDLTDSQLCAGVPWPSEHNGLTSGFAESAVKNTNGATENGDEILMPLLTSLSKLNALVLSAFRTFTEQRKTGCHQRFYKT